ncbi:hypothetical protein C4K14_4158 [Pseudomonas chlororaphis subsp. aureofaciens]|nr:hypothetical protein C4K14_4158 [Pseudomonas chlororaphis subsp. aureofaciens]
MARALLEVGEIQYFMRIQQTLADFVQSVPTLVVLSIQFGLTQHHAEDAIERGAQFVYWPSEQQR